MITAELDTGPPKRRRPGGKPGQRKLSISEPTIDIYAGGSQLSSNLVRAEGHIAGAYPGGRAYALVAFSIRLDRVDESLLYQDKGGNYWLSGVCVFETDAKGRTLVVQSIPPVRYKTGERGPQLGHWREIGKPKPGQPGTPGTPGFNLSKYKKSPAQNGPPQEDAIPRQDQELLFPAPTNCLRRDKRSRAGAR